jgi:hypothetical protein
MNKNVLLISAILSALAAFPANASDDNEHETNPVTVPVVTTPNPNNVTVTNNSTNTVDNVVSNVLDNHNTAYTNNTNTLRQDQAQTQVQDQQQQQEATSYSTSQGGSAVAHGGAATASGNGSGNSTTINQSYNDVYRERLNPVHSAVGSNLTSGADTCLGSVTGGVQTQILGVSGGKTVVDENCVLIKNTKLLLTMGLPSAACFYVRQDPKIDEAMVAAGVECREPPAVPAVVKPEDPSHPGFDVKGVYK